jgi:two-component system, NtrC family, sensor kinase
MQELLLFARPPNPKPAPVEIAPLVEATANLLKSNAALRHIQVSVEGGHPVVEADAGLLTIVIENVLANAAQAMEGRGSIRVSVEEVENACHILISDSGPGIPTDVLEKIFTPFFTTKARGSGLGLPTAKRLIEAQRGQIAVASPPGGGTTVTITLPALGAAPV